MTTDATRLTIDLGAVVANWTLLGTHHPSGPVGAVLKADGYGLGASAVATALLDAGCRHFFVAHLAEALPLRPLLPGTMIAVLNGLWPGDAATYATHDIAPVLGSLAEIDDWHGRAPALLHVETGMNRLGLDIDALDALNARRRRGEWLYAMTHLRSAEQPDDPANEMQRGRFEAACALLPAMPRSLANSSGIFLGPAFGSDLARPGAALYGVNPRPGHPNPMQPVVQLQARILQVRDVPAGEAVGYNGVWIAPRPSRIATVSVGYADGYSRALMGRGQARFDGHPVPMVGRVSMDLTTYDVTDLRATAGDWLELIGPGHTVDDVASEAGTNGYEILTQLGHRYARNMISGRTV